MTRHIAVCNDRDKYKSPVSVSYRIGIDRRGSLGPQTIVLWRCRKCKAVKTHVITGTWTIDEIHGKPVDQRILLEAEAAAQSMITDQLATEALEMVAPKASPSAAVAESDISRPADVFTPELTAKLMELGNRRPRPTLEPQLVPEKHDQVYAVNSLAERSAAAPAQPPWDDAPAPGLPVRVPGQGPQIPRHSRDAR